MLETGTPWSIKPHEETQFFVCVYEGSIETKDNLERSQEIIAPAVVLFQGSGNLDIAAGTNGASLLYCEGQPINETVARIGPFVMNTEAELMQAIEDYNSGQLAI